MSKPEDAFVEGVRAAVKKAGMPYLEKRARDERGGEDMGWFFDRLAAQLLVLKTGKVEGEADV